MNFTFTNAVARGWQTFRARYKPLLGAGAVFLLAVGVAGVVLESVNVPDLEILLYVFFDGPLWAGMMWLAVGHARGESPALKTLINGFTRARYPALVGVSALLLLILWLAPFAFLLLVAVGFSLAWFDLSGGAVIVIAAPFLAASVCFAVRLMFAPLICLDRAVGVKQSFTASWRLTAPVFWQLLGLAVAGVALCIVSAVLFVLPLLFFGFPLTVAVMAAAYHLIVDADAAAVTTDAADFG